MPWEFVDDSPIYLQLVDYFKKQIAAGELNGGDKMPSVRDLAMEAGVNPNTMQKALAELERQGYLYTKRTSGRFVSDNISQNELKTMQAKKFMKEFTEHMRNLGFDEEEIIEVYSGYLLREEL